MIMGVMKMENNPLEKIESLIEKGRSFRNFTEFEVRAAADGTEMTVEGIACVFNQPTVLYSYDGIDYKEIVNSDAFRSCDMTDVIFNYNHFFCYKQKNKRQKIQAANKPIKPFNGQKIQHKEKLKALKSFLNQTLLIIT